MFFTAIVALMVLVHKTEAGSECTKLPYNLFGPLKTHSKAQAFCTSKYPIPRPTCLVSTTIIATITPPAVVVQESTTTTVTVVPVCNPVKRGAVPTTTKKPDPLETLFSSLQQQASSFVKTLCSCIETTPPCTTSTKTSNIATTLPAATTTVTNTVTALTTSVCPPPPQATCPGSVVPQTCSYDSFCNDDCYCAQSAEGAAFCIDTNASQESCPATQNCSRSSDCPSDRFCTVTSCCGFPVCQKMIIGACPNGASVSRLFRRKVEGDVVAARKVSGKMLNPVKPKNMQRV
ncbi:hypothetical protein IQ06DRAFT_338115 [Phaeosphaeriaceae sp. SRC1lsM3a]|nr:hypothetical protein IQ06DRAFT_338115 [Stagonospora sp. SRC1lsM3a]